MGDSKELHAGAAACQHVMSRMQVSEQWPATTGGAYDYADVLHKSFIFYFQQRSGKLPHQVPLPDLAPSVCVWVELSEEHATHHVPTAVPPKGMHAFITSRESSMHATVQSTHCHHWHHTVEWIHLNTCTRSAWRGARTPARSARAPAGRT